MIEFYSNEPSETWRFGDVIQGFINVTPTINKPTDSNPKYDIKIEHNLYFAILSPCCSIDSQTISLAPLIPLNSHFLKNEYIKEDFTRINNKIESQHSIPTKGWNSLNAEEKTNLLEQGEKYIYIEQFVYQKSDLLQEYDYDDPVQKAKIKLGYYMIDFRDVFKVSCDLIKRNNDMPKGLKILELSLDSRNELRNKIKEYYRTPAEDLALMD